MLDMKILQTVLKTPVIENLIKDLPKTARKIAIVVVAFFSAMAIGGVVLSFSTYVFPNMVTVVNVYILFPLVILVSSSTVGVFCLVFETWLTKLKQSQSSVKKKDCKFFLQQVKNEKLKERIKIVEDSISNDLTKILDYENKRENPQYTTIKIFNENNSLICNDIL